MPWKNSFKMQKITFTKLLCIVIAILLLTGIKPGMILCYQSTGYGVVEVASYDNRCQPAGSAGKNIFPPEPKNGLLPTEGCSPCSDVPLSLTGLLRDFLPHQILSLKWSAGGDAPCSTMVFTLAKPEKRVIRSLPSPNLNHIFYCLRTTVLLI